MERVIKYVRHPAFTSASLVTRNPFLEVGEIVFELDSTNVPVKFKVGPGYWNSLPYFIDNRYLFTTSPTNPLGDATGNLSGLTTREILEKILHPYVVPAISNVLNNAEGVFANSRVIEIGKTISGTIQVTYSITNPGNLLGAAPINVSAGGIFNNEGGHVNTGSLSLGLLAPLIPVTLTTYTISLTATHQKGVSSAVISTIKFQPKIIWGVSSLSSYTANDINNLSAKQTVLASSHKRDYTFTGQGYCVLAIPAMLNPTSVIFTDVTDPSAPGGFSMEDLGTLSINNGVGTYSYQIFRSTFSITQSSSILRVT